MFQLTKSAHEWKLWSFAKPALNASNKVIKQEKKQNNEFIPAKLMMFLLKYDISANDSNKEKIIFSSFKMIFARNNYLLLQ